MRVALGSDHAGFKLKEKIKVLLGGKGIEYRDFGTYSEESCDYPDYVHMVAKAVVSGDCDRGIFACKRHKGVPGFQRGSGKTQQGAQRRELPCAWRCAGP